MDAAESGSKKKKVAVVSPDTILTDIDTKGIGFYSLLSKDGSRIDALRALLEKYAWTKVGILYVQNHEGDLSTRLDFAHLAVPPWHTPLLSDIDC
jgi:hypothetical protein